MSSIPSTSGTSQHNTNCCAYGCTSRKCKDNNLHFHYFSKKNSDIRVKLVNALGQEEEIDKRKAWKKVLLSGKPVTKSMRVCSKHFQVEDYCAKGIQLKQPKLKGFAVPSLNLPTRRSYSDGKKKTKTDFHEERLAKRPKVKDEETKNIGDNPLSAISFSENENCTTSKVKPRTYEQLSEEEKIAVYELVSFTSEKKLKFVDKEIQVSSGDIMVTFTSTIKEDKNLNSLTGISKFHILHSLTMLVISPHMYLPETQYQLKLYIWNSKVLLLPLCTYFPC